MAEIAARKSPTKRAPPISRRSSSPAPRGSAAPKAHRKDARSVRPRAGRTAPGDEPARVLIIEDDPGSVGERSAIIKQAGHLPITITWPANLARMLEAHTPDLLMLGVGAGETWGFDLCADLRTTDPGHDLPVLLVVSDRDEDAIERGLRAGADDVVRVSTGAGELQARVAVQLRNKRHRDTLRSLRSERDAFQLKATIDPLTKVLNRGALEEALLAMHTRGEPFAVMFVDLDHFKSVNDKFGHDAGDTVLRELGKYLVRAIRSNDVAGRYGGEEFVIGLAGCDQTLAPRIAERHREAVAKIVFPKENHPERITASIGVAVFNPEAPDATVTELLKRADACVYRAKHEGRNRVIIAPPREKSAEEPSPTAKAEVASRHPIAIAGPQRASSAVLALEAELVKRLNSGLTSLPVIPVVAMAALRMAQRPNVNITALASLVEKDPFLAARLLAVGNSTVYYRGIRTASTHAAIVRMGLAEARDVLANLAYSASLPKYDDLLQQLSERSILAARAAQSACRELGWSYEPAYLCGLLHDLGEARVLRILAGLPTPPEGLRVILHLVARYHAQAGAQLAEQWNMHADIVAACALHHDERASDAKPVRLAMISDLLVHRASQPHEEALGEEELAEWTRLGLTEAQVSRLLVSMKG
jgi:diguanylate cyclase (GGDEF)-like protein/putative nucleotidyltransferase with HDIG domain